MNFLKNTVLAILVGLTVMGSADLLAAPKKKTKAKAKPATAQKAAPSPTPSASAPAAATEDAPAKGFQRLDPHGKPDAKLSEMKISEHPECRVCHLPVAPAGKKIGTKPDPANLCASCHGRLVHSGLVEHMGEEPGGGAGLDCLACHRPHRATSDGSPAVDRKTSFLKRPKTDLPKAANTEGGTEELVDRPYAKDGKGHTAGDAMIDHPCTECHSF